MPTEKELLDRIHYLEEINSALQDKLDEIWAVLSPVYETEEDGLEQGPDEKDEERLIQIDVPFKRPS